jgi:primary-amine oxidase
MEQTPPPSPASHDRRFSVVALVLIAVAAAAFGFGLLAGGRALLAQSGLDCSSANLVDVTLPTGARWEMCWEHRAMEGIVYRDIHFTPPGGPRRKVLAQANLAQIHVPYDDNAARFHDVSSFGAGGNNLNSLEPSDCPNGDLLKFGTKNALCRQVEARGYAIKFGSRDMQGYQLSLFSVSQIGAYAYIAEWHFFDDGTIEPLMGAAGKLQRFDAAGADAFSWELGDNGDPVGGIAHIHNYYWRLDFDIDGAENDAVQQIDLLPTADDEANERYSISITNVTTELAAAVNPATFRSWRILDTAVTNSDGHPISYEIAPLRTGHIHQGPSYEPWTSHQIYFTTNKLCERYATNNGACGGNQNLASYTNGESLVGEDVVVWYGINFHHLPRDEDQDVMPVHFDSFQISPRDWTSTNPLGYVTPAGPTATATPQVITNTVVLTNTVVVTQTVTVTNTVIATPAPTATPQTPAAGCFTFPAGDLPQTLHRGESWISSSQAISMHMPINAMQVQMQIDHQWVGDLVVSLVHQDTGTAVRLLDRPGVPDTLYGCRYDNVDGTFADTAETTANTLCFAGIPTVSGLVRPAQPLAAFDGESSSGVWLLTVADLYPVEDSGQLNSWSLTLCTGGDQPGLAATPAIRVAPDDSSPDRDETVREPVQKVFLPQVSQP